MQQLKDAADSGVDCIHLDEADTPTGKFLIDGTTAIQGVMLLVKQIRDTYPQMAVMTEEFNPMCSRYASFCFSEFDDAHPLGGYIFHKFIKFYPEGYMAAPMMPSYMDANEKWGFFMPVADVKWTQSWLPIARAFEYYDLMQRLGFRCGRDSSPHIPARMGSPGFLKPSRIGGDSLSINRESSPPGTAPDISESRNGVDQRTAKLARIRWSDVDRSRSDQELLLR